MNERRLQKEMYLISGKDSVVDFWVTLCIVCRLGFPGILAETYGFLTPLIDYGSCGVQLLVILLASGNTLGELRLLDLKKKYGMIYFMLGVLLVQSFWVTSDVKAELTTSLRFVVTVMFGLWLADHYDTSRLLEILCNAQTIFVMLNLLLFFVFRRWGFYYDEEGRYLFHGLMNRKNSLGEELAFGLVLQTAFFWIKRRAKELPRLFWWFGLAAQLFLLVSTKAVGALFTAIVPIAYLVLHEKMQGRLPRLHWSYIYIVVSVGFLIVALTILPLFSPFLESLGKDATLSNRTIMWEEIIPFMMEDHTLTGYGLLMFWNDKQALKSLQERYGRDSWFRTMNYGSHNTLLEMWLDVGLIGIALYFLVLIYSFRRIKNFSEEQYLACSAFILPLMIRGLTERSFTSAGYLTLFLFVMLGVACTGSELKLPKYPRRPFLRAEEEKQDDGHRKKTGAIGLFGRD